MGVRGVDIFWNNTTNILYCVVPRVMPLPLAGVF